MSLPSGSSASSASSGSSGARSVPIPPAGLRRRSVRANSENDDIISVGTRAGTDVPANPRGRSISAQTSPASPGTEPPAPSVSRSNSSTTQPSRRSARQAVEKRNTSTRRVSIRRSHQRVNYNPDAPPSATAAIAAGEVLDPSNIPTVRLESGLSQPKRARLPQTTYPSGDSQTPISTDTLHQGLTTEQAVQRSRRRPGRTPQVARNEADRLSDEVRNAHSKAD